YVRKVGAPRGIDRWRHENVAFPYFSEIFNGKAHTGDAFHDPCGTCIPLQLGYLALIHILCAKPSLYRVIVEPVFVDHYGIRKIIGGRAKGLRCLPLLELFENRLAAGNLRRPVLPSVRGYSAIPARYAVMEHLGYLEPIHE